MKKNPWSGGISMSYFDRGPRYRDREEAGEVLASRLEEYRGEDLVILAIPNGGVPVAYVISDRLAADLYLLVVRKLQLPDNPEAGFGALTSDGFILLNHELTHSAGLSESDIERQKEKAMESIRKRQEFFGQRAVLPPLEGRSVLLVDDGLASGFTMSAAVESVKKKGAKEVMIAVPTSSASAYERLEPKVDKIICPDVSGLNFFAVANAYEHWYDLSMEEVLKLLLSLPSPIPA
jgi:putative phosphoribosyl transferase